MKRSSASDSMYDRCFLLVSRFVTDKRRSLPWIVIVLVLLASAGLGLLRFDGSIEMMLPDRGEIHKTIDFLRSSNISDKIIISLSLNSDTKNKDDLIEGVRELEASLDPPLFTRTVSGTSQDVIMDRLLSPDYFPRIAVEDDFRDMEGMISHEYVSARMKEIYSQLLRPQSMFAAPMFYSDPLGIRMKALEKIRDRSVFTDYKVGIEDGYFISADEKHAMIIADTPVAVTDSVRSKELLKALDEKTSSLPDYISADIIGGHTHTVSNEKVIKDDISLTVTIASVAFLILFLVIFRDIRAVLVFLIPAVSVLLSMNLSSFILGRLSYWVAGLGTVIAGISVDYGIHIFVTVRNSGRDPHAISEVSKPVAVGALTTMGVFAAFFFSDIQGYHQLALFSIISIFLSLLLALFVLPLFLSKGEWLFKMPQWKNSKNRTTIKPDLFDKVLVVCWGVLMTASLYLSFDVRFDNDVVKLDGSEPSVFEAEENFHKTWGGKDNQAVFVLTGNDYERILETNDLIYEEVSGIIGRNNFTSLSVLWPSLARQNRNIEQWNSFWQDGRERELRRLLSEEGSRFGFVDTAFESFFRDLYIDRVSDTGANDGFLNMLKERFVQKTDDGFRILSFFPDKEEFIEKLSGLRKNYPDSFIVSRNNLSAAISESLSAEVKLFTLIATITIILLTLLLLRNLRSALLALVPVITNVLMILGVMSLTGLSLNIANMIAAIVAMGLCIDYGIFMTYRYKDEIKKSAVLSLTLSAVTTIIGAGVLVFAEHPALFSIGVTLVTGVTAGYISSILVIPAIEKMLPVSGSV